MIKLIIFDLGKVILDFSHRDIAEGLAPFSAAPGYQDPDNILDHMFNNGAVIVNLYEEGRITSEEFFSYIRETYRLDISFLHFKQVWNEIFTENKGVTELIERLKKEIPIFLLSNTNELHFEYVKKKFPIVHKFDKWILSYETGMRKPCPEIFQTALGKAGVLPAEAIFIDDIREHVVGAQGLGINAVEFKSVEQATIYIEEKIYESAKR